MDLFTVREIVRPVARDRVPVWRRGDAWLAGGTWLFSEPQPGVSRLVDLDGFGWPAIVREDSGLHIAATCRIAELYAFEPPDEWPAAALIRPCCEALLASFKIWNMATIGGNLCLALPAGSLISLTVALEGSCTLWQEDGGERVVPAAAFVTGISSTLLQPGELLRGIALPVSALRKRVAFRRIARSRLGRSTILLIGTSSSSDSGFSLTVSAATTRPIRLDFPLVPLAAELRAAIEAAVPAPLYFDDAHGTSGYRRHMTYHLAEEIRQELAAEADQCRSL